ncbi:MAG: hypothetical protein HYV29_03735 [Ignavibacteriales bacterium]|nr:hypothetical protein [Ignavibacteriales bacterium]
MKQILFIAFIVSSFAVAGEGSIYSRYGIGEIHLGSRGKNIAMGSVGVGMFGETFINFANPAGIANISRTLVTAGYQYRNYNSEDATGTSVIGTGNINEFGIAIPIYAPKKMVLSLGVLPFSTVGYLQEATETVSGSSVIQQFEGRGGLNSAQLSMSYAATSDLAVGLTAHYLFGAIYKDHTINFSSSDFFGGSYNQTLSLSGFGLTLGGLYAQIDKALGLSTTGNLNLGATFFTGSSLDFDDEILRNFSSNQDTVAVDNKSISLPFGFSVGLSYNRNRIVYAADVDFQNWDNFKINGIKPAEMQNSIRAGVGVEFLPSDNFVDSFWDKVSYRLGGYYRVTNTKVNGTSINEIFASGGLGFPLSFDSRLNLGLEYGIRGTTSSLLIKDTIIRFTVSLTASELMFIPPPID